MTSRKKAFQPIGLGDRVEDPITGFTGIVTAVTHWLNGCMRISVQPETLHEGRVQSPEYFDQSQLRMVQKGVHAPVVLGVVDAPPAEARKTTGGPPRETAGFRR